MVAKGDNAPEAGAPAEIELTPDMVSAGAKVILRAFDGVISPSDLTYPAHVAEEVFSAMFAARRKERGKSTW